MVGKVLYIKYKEIVDGQIVEKVRYAVDRWQADDKYMGESFITFTVKSPKPIAFSVGDYCEYRGETYTLNYIPSVSQRANIGGSGEAFVYDQVKMDSPREELDRAIMLDVTPTTGDYIAALGTNYTGSAQFQLYCGETTANGRTLTPVCALAAKMQANLDRAFPDKGWKVLVDTTSTHEEAGQQVLNTHSDEKTLTFDNTTIANALAEVKNTFEIDFAVKGRTIYIGYTFGAITGNDDGDYYYFGYGKGYLSEDNQGKALFELKRTSDSGQKIVTRLRALGSTKNMPYRYYNKKYNLSQSLFPMNLQLPDTFETPEVKAKHNKERKAVYPWIRDVLGDTNDAYIDKNDNCLNTVEGLREDCMRWDGTNADLKEIYPSIEEVTYGELRAALCEDQDGNKGSSAFPHYGNNERVDEILDIDTDTNVGDGILTESDSTKQTASDTDVRLSSSETASSLVYMGSGYISKEKEVMSIASQYAGNYIISNSHLWFRASYSLGRHQSENITKTCKVAYQIKVWAKDLSTSKESVICTYVSDFKEIGNRASKEYEVEVAKLPDVDAAIQKVDKITVTNPSDIRITFALIVKDIDYSYDQWNVNWNLGLSLYETPDTDTEWTPSLIWDLEGSASTFMKNPFHVYVKDMGFDFVAAFGTSDTPKIAMKSGMCVAREFTIGNNPQKVEYTKDGITYKAWRLTLAKAEDSSLKTYYPSENFPLAAGDNFVIIGIEMPDVYIQAASMKLLVEATKALADVCDTKHEYEPSVDDIYIQRNYDRCEEQGDVTKSVYWKLGAGMKFPFFGIAEEGKETPDMFSMIIDTLSIREGEGLTPKISIKLSEDFQQSTLQKLTRTVTSITNGSIFKATSIGNGGGLDESSVRAIVSEFTKRRYLSKLNPDTAAGIITFLQGTNWGNFTSETGAAMTVDPTTGQTYMEVDRLKVRLKAFFEQLEVQKVGYVGGKIVVSKGQGVDILDVEEIYDSEGNLSAYRCYFLGEQEGRRINNLLRVDDQMICKDENISEGSTDGATNKYYWRLATAVSSDVVKRGNNVCHWVDLSATDYDTISDDVPEIGDTICQLGNRNDIDRQGAEVLSVVDANSPSFTIYAGIDSYSLVNKEYIDMGVSEGKAYCNIYGSTYIGDRERKTGYLRWNDDTKTFEIKGTIDISSPLSSGGTIGGAISSAANAYKDDFSSFTSNVNEIIGGFQKQIDGVIETWFYDPEPKLDNLPASEWKDNDTKDKHLGDLYYSKDGLAYRFQKEGDIYKWVQIDDTAITSALKEAKAAKDAAAAAQGTADSAQTTANSKMKVFVKQPTNNDEYSIGDMWVNATYPADGSTYNNEILHCVTDKAAGEAFSISHWAQSSNIKTQFNNFVNNTYAEDKKDFYNQLDGKVETWYQSADPKDKWEAADYSKHKGDIWYNDSTNKSYRWMGTAWVELKDQAAIDAKALAESKRRVFTTTTLPTPPYDARDLWVQGENGDIMVCVTPKAAGTTASASDWEKASKYTDDTKAKEALTKVGDLQTDVTELGDSFVTLTDVTLPAISDGIITTSEKENIRQALMQVQKECVDVINAYANLTVNYKSIYDNIAADVRTNFATAYTNLMGSATLSSDGTITYTSGQGGAYGALVDNINALLNKEGNLTTNEIATINNNIANFNIKYNDFQNRLVVVRNDIEKTLDTRITKVDEQLGGYAYLKKIVGGKTTIDGGLVLTTMLGTGYEVTGGTYKIMSGISGLYEKPTSVAIWAGGSMTDKFVYYDAESGKFNVPDDVNPANFLVRMDGTGYAAGGNFWWDNDGKIHADPQSFLINEQYVGNVMQLFELHYREAGKTEFTNVDYVTPTRMFNGLELSDKGLQIGDTAKLYIKNGVLFIEGDLAVTGGITMYASDGVKSGMIDQVYAVLDQSLFSIVDGAITITGEIGSGTVKGIAIKGTQYDPDNNGIIALTLNWGDLTGVPTTFTPSAHNHNDLYYTETEIDTKLGLKLDTSLKGTANGLATLDASGKVPSAQLPSYVDDVLECINKASFPTTGESGKIYIDQTTNLTYRWGGTAYVEISQSLALGETSSTAYAGDKGKQNAADIAALKTGKADKATTLAGYGITDAYTKTETYTQTEVNTKLTDGSVTKVGKVDVGSATKPIYLKAGVPTAVGTSLAVDITGNSATTSKLKTAVTLWGQSFDGSKAITGNLTNVGTITPTGEDLKVVGNLIVTGGIVMYADDGATIESGFAALLAAHIDGVTIKYNEAQQKIYSVMTGVKVNGTTYKPSETDGYITIPDYPTSLDWKYIDNKPSSFTPASHTHTFASLTSKPTTLSGYGITDAKIANGVITLGTATITPLTAHQTVTLASGTNNGTLKLTVGSKTTDNIEVKGLGSAAYTEASAYATAGHTHSYAGSASAGGAAYSANKVNSRGNLTAYAEGSTTMGESGVNLYTVYNNGYPVAHGNLLHIYGLGAGQLLAEWCGSSTLGHLYYRSKRDNSNNGWSAWGKVAFTTDNVASASKWATARKITLKGSVTGEVSIDGSGDVSLTTTTNHTHSYVPLSGGTMTGNLILKGGTSADMTYAGNAHPYIRFDNSDSSQNVSLIFTDYDSYRSPAGLKLVGNQGNEWFEAANIYATTFYGALSGNASTATTATKLGTANVGSGTQHFYLSGGTATASTSTVGGTAKPMYLKAGVMTAISDTVGGTAKPIFLNGGTLTAISATVGSASKPVYLNGGSVTACSYDFTSYLPLSGGTMGGTAWIVWPDSGNWGNNNSGVTFPVTRGGLHWVGQSDWIKLYSQETGGDNLNLVLQFGDDNSNGLSIRNSGGSQTAFISATGHITAANGTVNGTLKVGAIPVTNSSTGVLKIDGNLIVTGGITMYATDGVASGLMEQILVDGTTIKKKADGTLYADVSVIGGGTVKGATVGGTAVTLGDGGILTFPAYPTLSSLGAAAANHTHSYLPLSGGTMTGVITGNTGNGLVVQSVNTGSWKEGIRVYPASNSYALLSLQDSSSNNVFAMVTNVSSHTAYFDYKKDGDYKRIDMPFNSGTLALTSDLTAYLPLAGGTLTGALRIDCPTSQANNYNEGLRCNLGGANSWASVVLGGASGSTSGSGSGVYSLLVNSSLFRIRQNSTDVISINTSNNVGIGTTSPSYKLHVAGDIYTTTGFKKNGSSDSYVLLGGGGHKLISDFATSGHTHSYLPLSGGTMTGVIILTSGSNAAYDKTALSFIKSSDKTEQARIGTDGGNGLGLYANGSIYIRPNVTLGSGSTNGLIISSSSFTYNGTAVSLAGHTHSYLPLSGGTVTGTLTLANASVTSGTDTTELFRIYSSTGYKNGLSIFSIDNKTYINAKPYGSGTANALYLRTYNSGVVDALTLAANGNATFVGSVTATSFSGNASSSTKSEYSRSLLGRNTSGGDYGASSDNMVFAEWNTKSDYRWYLRASGYECRVAYASSAATATALTSSAGSATLPIYFSDGKPVACTASSVFSNLSNSGNNISVTVAGQNRTLTVGYADTVDGYHASSFTKKHTEYDFNTTGTAPYNYVWLCRIGNSNGYSGMAITLDVNSRYHKHYQINMLISTRQYAYSSSSISINKSDSAPNVYYVRTANGSDIGYDYFDIYVDCGAWNYGGYKIANTNVQGALQFTNKCTLVDSLPSGATAVGLMYSSVNYATSAGNSDTCDGLHVHGGRNNEANKIVRTDGNGYLQVGYINSSNGNEGNNSSPARVWGTNGSDSYMRTYLTSALAVATATKWATARKITLTGSVTGSVSIDGSGDVTLATTTNHTHSYLPLSGGTMTGALNFKNGTWNLMGDDAYIGDCNVGGMIGVKGANAATPGFVLYNNSGTLLGKLYASGNTLVWDGGTIQTTTFSGNASTASKWATARTLTLTGSVTGSVSIDGSGNVTLATTTNHTHSYLPLSGGNMTGTIGVQSNTQNGGLKFNNNAANLNALNDQHLILGKAIRFGAYDTWDWNVWAGLKYDSSSKTIYLGLADGTTFNANTAQSGGSVRFPGVSTVYAPTFSGSLSGNASTATNADKLDGVHYENILDRTFTKASRLSSAGWYRIAQTNTRNGDGASFILVINRLFNNNDNEAYTFSVNITYSGVAITQISGYANDTLIPKIRIDKPRGNNICYVDIYYNSSSGNDVRYFTIGNAVCISATAKPTLVGTATEFSTSDGISTNKNILAAGGITMHNTSDRRLKKNIRGFNACDELMKLGGVYQFEYIDEEIERNKIYKGSHIGLLYQNVKGTILDKMCFEREDGYGALNYLDTSFISLLAGVGVEHETRLRGIEGTFKKYESKTDKKIRLMKKKINDLEEANKALDARIKELEERRTA